MIIDYRFMGIQESVYAPTNSVAGTRST